MTRARDDTRPRCPRCSARVEALPGFAIPEEPRQGGLSQGRLPGLPDPTEGKLCRRCIRVILWERDQDQAEVNQ